MPVLICLRKELWTGLISVGDQVPTCPVFTRAKIKSRFGILVIFPVTLYTCYCSLHYFRTQFNVKLSLTLIARVNHIIDLNATKNSLNRTASYYRTILYKFYFTYILNNIKMNKKLFMKAWFYFIWWFKTRAKSPNDSLYLSDIVWLGQMPHASSIRWQTPFFCFILQTVILKQ